MAETVRAYLGLGSNLGDRQAMLRLALQGLAQTSGVEIDGVSRVYETLAVGPGDQGAYLNAAVSIRTELEPDALLARMLAIEHEAGRDREREVERWTARTLDLDLLLYGDRCLEMRGLEVPHPRLHERGFVLEPLRDLAPELVHPRMKRTIEELARAVRDESAVRLWPHELAIPV